MSSEGSFVHLGVGGTRPPFQYRPGCSRFQKAGVGDIVRFREGRGIQGGEKWVACS